MIEMLLLPSGDTLEERLKQLALDVKKCFSRNTDFDKLPQTKPYLNWHLVNHKLLQLISRGHFIAERGYIFEALYLSTAIIEKVSEMYIKDEVWSDTSLDGEETLIFYNAIKLTESIINNNALPIDTLIELNHQFSIFGGMEAHMQYGLYSFNDIQDKIVAKIYNTV